MFITIGHEELFPALKKIQSKWEKFTYQEKLEFWANEAFTLLESIKPVEGENKFIFSNRHEPAFVGTYVSNRENPKTKELEQVLISIIPHSIVEAQQYLEYFIDKFISNHEDYSFEKWKTKYEEQIKNSGNPEKSIDEIIQEIESGNFQVWESEPKVERPIHKTISQQYQSEYQSGRSYFLGKPINFNLLPKQVVIDENGNEKINFAPCNFLAIYLGFRDEKLLAYFKRMKETGGNLLTGLPKLQWKDNNKTELSLLIVSLFRSNRILINGKPIQQKELKRIFETLFSIELDNLNDLVRAAITTNKAAFDEKHFISELKNLIERKS